MRIRVGYEFIYSLPQPTPMILTVSIHYSRASDIVIPDYLTTDPPVPMQIDDASALTIDTCGRIRPPFSATASITSGTPAYQTSSFLPLSSRL